MSTRRRW